MSDNIESGMVFVRSRDGFFNVEKSATMGSIGDGVKICEFFSRIERNGKPKLFLVEAKSSSPKPASSGGKPDRWEDYSAGIYEKFINALLIYLGLKTGRKYAVRSELPSAIAEDELGSLAILPCLVLRDHPVEALPPVQDELRMRLDHVVKSFRLEQPIAINRDMAISYGLVEQDRKEPVP
ncbi:MAG TPA: hypothetical protein VMV90_03175 [Rectinemataceae bacterium]|nr:hypothetical protein [Rectinemataceae bacterium]